MVGCCGFCLTCRTDHDENWDYCWHYARLLAGCSAVAVVSIPAILGADGEPLAGGLVELERVELNGSQQWITIRGQDYGKPVLLFLAGGPGGSQFAATRSKLGALEERCRELGSPVPASPIKPPILRLYSQAVYCRRSRIDPLSATEIWRGKDLSAR